MPNHVQNRLQVIGDSEEVKKLTEHIKGKYDDGSEMQIDFNKIKPVPKGLEIEIHSGIETAVKVALRMPVNDNQLIGALENANREKFKSPLTFSEDEWSQYINCLNNVRSTGFIYWYDWNCENWGTKWNAYQQNDERNTDDTIYFQTAWSSPIDLIKLLSSQFPKVKILLTYADEDSGNNTGKFEIQNGEVISFEQPKSQSIEGYKIYFELHPDDVDNYKLVNGKYEYVEE